MTTEQPPAPDPLSVPCSRCKVPAGEKCISWPGRYDRKPHAPRVRLAFVLAAHADPALDAFFPRRGRCGLCWTPGLDQRHRVVDGIAGMLAAGEDPEVTAEEHLVPPEAVEAVQAWAKRWPGAWL